MLTKFSILYVGFTELDNVGLGGNLAWTPLPLWERSPRNSR